MSSTRGVTGRDRVRRALDLFSPRPASGSPARSRRRPPAQELAWTAAAGGKDALVIAPTGSGKTLAAFLWSLDQLAQQGAPEDPARRCRVLYISPLKALAVDVERNLRAPLTGIRHAAARQGAPVPDITVGLRSGDTPADERRRLAAHPPDILITTPESLFLLLTSQARETLRGVQTVIVDEVHAVAGTKRGAHLAVSLERLDALLDQPAQRIGLSATVRPPEEVARFLCATREVVIVQPPATRQVELTVVVPVEDLSDLAAAGPGPTQRRTRRRRRRRRPAARGGRAGTARVDLAARRGPHRRSRRAAPLDDRVRELPPARRAADRTAQRDRARAPDRRALAVRLGAGRGDGPERREPGRTRRHRPRAPRLGLQGAARDRRGGAQGRPAAGRGGDQQPRARRRHGRGRPRDPGRAPAVGGERAATRRAGPVTRSARSAPA